MRIISVVTISMLFLSGAAFAQERRTTRGGILIGPGPGMGPGAGIGVDIVGVEPLGVSTPVVGAPFSADTTTDTVQQLADGNRIELHTSGRMARDSRGRIRRDQTVTGFGPAAQSEEVRIVTINDPASGELYRLDEARRIAWKLPGPRVVMRERVDGEPARLPRLQQGLKTESLGTMPFDGVTAEGTRTILVLPVGAIGNERPIEITSDRWYSAELGVVVSTKRVDPRVGEVTYRLTNIDRSEPPADLFEVPPGFRVQEQAPLGPRPAPR